MLKKTVLILCDNFPPGLAPRMGYLAKYIGDYTWKAVAVSPTYDNDVHKKFGFLSGYIPHKGIYISKQEMENNKVLSFFFPSMRYSNKLHREMECHTREIMAKEKIDIILCSTCEYFPLNIASNIAKKNNIPWIADLRDIYEQYPLKQSFLRELRKKMGIVQRNKLLKKANMIVTVSKKHIEILKSYDFTSCHIYNGADTDIFFPSKNCNFDKFRIVYTGGLSDERLGQDISPLFSAIHQLHQNNEIDHENCRIQFYSDPESQKKINVLKESFLLSDFVDCFDYVPGSEIPKIINESSVLLVLLNKGNTGIMTTKFFEYLAVGRPILCIWSDEGEVEDIINNSKAGIAAKTENDILVFIKTKYEEWLQHGYTHSNIDFNFIKNFSRKHNAKQFAELFDFVLEK